MFFFQIINGVCVEELSKGDENMPEKYSEEETVIKLSNLQRLEVLLKFSSSLLSDLYLINQFFVVFRVNYPSS